MITDQFLSLYLNTLLEKQRGIQEGLNSNRFESLYEVGKLQGQLEGMRQAISILENLAEEADQ